ncbi:MAG: sulfite exporter TauE/SafE family protein [Lentisphaeria bacterium]|nr:sulfite exporter TauE/SafE family protein [Lentisphaeria bacterium]
MTFTVVVSYVALLFITRGAEIPPGGMALSSVTLLMFGFFLLSFAIAVIAVLAGIGGGVIYTPIMLAFTPVNSLIVRATGLLVAMFSGLVSSGPFLKRGIGNLKLAILCNLGYGIGGFTGAQGAIWVSRHMGSTGEGGIRLALGTIVLLLAVYFIAGGVKMEWPQVRRIDRFSRWLRVGNPYYEPSVDRVVDYPVTRIGWGMATMAVLGVMSGFFGLGAGWAIVPAINCIMGVPLKVAASISGIVIGMGDCITVWPYFFAGAVIPLFAAPWLAGQVLGGILGAHVLIRVRAESIRYLLIGILIHTSFGLVTNGLRKLGVMGAVPGSVHVTVLLAIMAWVIVIVLRRSAKRGDTA